MNNLILVFQTGWIFPTNETKYRYNSYRHQLEEIIPSSAQSVLEIGVRNNVIALFLESKNIQVTTLDLKHNLRPNTVGFVLSTPFKDKSFDVVVCCQVLKHLLFSSFDACISDTNLYSMEY